MVYPLRREGDGGTLLASGVPYRQHNLYPSAEAGDAVPIMISHRPTFEKLASFLDLDSRLGF